MPASVRILPLASAFAVLLLLVPTASLVWQGFSVPDETLAHLRETVLGRYLGGTFALMALVLPGVLTIGAGAAWLVARCTFPFRRFLGWALLLPFAAPPYILAYVYTDALQDAFPDVRSLPVAALLFSCVLYPYVYLLARASFEEQSTRLSEAARMLGCTGWGAFLRVGLPLARPSLVAGAAMALMEVAADFGTVEYFAIDTLSTGVYRTWFALGSKAGAARLALVLLVVAFLLLTLEKWGRRRARYFAGGPSAGGNGVAGGPVRTAPRRARLSGARAFAAVAFCALPVCLGFLVPVGLLARSVVREGWRHADAEFAAMAARSFGVALAAALVCCVLGAVVAWGVRDARARLGRAAANLASVGYAMPGSVLAVGVLFPLGAADAWLGEAWTGLTGRETGLILSGTLVALIYAYCVRFGAIPLQGLQAALGRVTPSLEASARTLGAGHWDTFRRVTLPLVSPSALAALVIVFVDVVKELPATLILRPFDFDTLAVRTYTLASDERLVEASPAALLIVLVGVIPVTLLHGLSRWRGR
jgi:iron(III) transport system permease protein